MKHFIMAFCVIPLCIYSSSVVAQTIPGDPNANTYYVEVHGGATFVQDSELTDPSFSGAGVSNVEATFDTGFNVGGLFGYKFSNGIRVEGEYTYRQADFDKLSACASGTCGSANLDGDVSAHALMANMFWEPRFGNWLSSIGGGIGVGFVNASPSVNVPGFGTFSADESDTVFAYQAGAGLGYPITNNVVVTVDYRYWATTDPDFNGTEAEIGTHNVSAGIRYGF